MKFKKLVALAVGVAMCGSLAAGLSACGDKGEKVVVWVSEKEGVKTLTENQIKKFQEANPDYGDYKVTVEGVSEAESATQMITDVSTGADIFCFAQDQMGRLVEAKALSKLGESSKKFVQEKNDASSVLASSTAEGDIYCYPLTSDNGYFMYYNKDVVKAEHLDDLAAIVQDCKDAEMNISFEINTSAWYIASFFFGAGCHSTWSFNATENKWKANDDFSDETKGLIALKGTQILTNSGCWVSSSSAADFTAATKSAVVVTGTWDAETAAKALGDKLGAAKLPHFKVDGKSYQLGSYSGNKLMGVKPQTSAEKAEFCHKLAQFLTDEECQMDRVKQFSWGPSNKAAAASQEVKDNVALNALAAQSPYATPQGQIHGGWWDVAKALGETQGKDEAALKGLLSTYKGEIDRFEKMSEEAMAAYGVVGSIASLANTKDNLSEGQTVWANWGADVAMTKSEKDGKVIWKSKVKITFKEGDQFQVRKGQAWSVQYGKVEEDGFSSKSNFVITAENAGSYYVVLTITDDGKDTQKGVVSLSAE